MYHFRKLRFEFKSTSSVFNGSNSNLGRVTMVTEYDELKGAFTTMRESENYEGATMFMPYQHANHTVDVRGRRLGAVLNYKTRYIRTSDLSSFHAFGGTADPHAYDVGLFHLCTQGTVAEQIGELWVHYSVDLIKPRVDYVNGNVFVMQTPERHADLDTTVSFVPTEETIFNANNNITTNIVFDTSDGYNKFTCTGVPSGMVIYIQAYIERVSGLGTLESGIDMDLGEGLAGVADSKYTNQWTFVNNVSTAALITLKARVTNPSFHFRVIAGNITSTAYWKTMITIEMCEWMDPVSAYPVTFEEYFKKLSMRNKQSNLPLSTIISCIPKHTTCQIPRPSLSTSDFEEVKSEDVKKL